MIAMTASHALCDNQTHSELLADGKGLTVIRGNMWLCRAEVELRSLLTTLPGRSEQIERMQVEIETLRASNARIWSARIRIGLLLEEIARNGGATEEEIRGWRAQVRRLESQSMAPDRLGGREDVRRKLIELTNARNEMILSLLQVPRLTAELEDDYRRLRRDAEVTAALQSLGARHRLGPSKNFDREFRRLEHIQDRVLTDWIPLYQTSGRSRLGVLINEEFPVTFTWVGTGRETLITASMAEAAGLEIDDNGETVRVTVGRRTLEVWPTMISSLRFGGTVFREVPAYVLPPEGEDLGAQIGLEAFSEPSAIVRPDLLRLIFQ